jgi:hypothetical protein
VSNQTTGIIMDPVLAGLLVWDRGQSSESCSSHNRLQAQHSKSKHTGEYCTGLTGQVASRKLQRERERERSPQGRERHKEESLIGGPSNTKLPATHNRWPKNNPLKSLYTGDPRMALAGIAEREARQF